MATESEKSQLQLERVPKILEQLGIPETYHQFILDYAKEHKMQAGDAVVAISRQEKNPLKAQNEQAIVITDEQKETALLNQVVQKAIAARQDLDTIAEKGKQETTLKAYWGNNNVTPAKEQPTITDAVSSIANTGANMIALINEKPDLAKNNEKIRDGVEAASQLALALAGKSEQPLTRETAQALMEKAKAGLRETVTQSGAELKDQKGNKIELEDFINARFGEIQSGIEQRLTVENAMRQERETLNKSGVTPAPAVALQGMPQILGGALAR